MNLIYEYTQNANPYMTSVPPGIFPPSLYETCLESMIIPLDTRSTLKTDYPATAPNLLAHFVKILSQQSVHCSANCTSHLFYVLRGSGRMTSTSSHESTLWEKGDLFVLPGNKNIVLFGDDPHESILYWVCDSPLLEYLGVQFTKEKFSTTFFKKDILYRNLMEVRHDEHHHDRNRVGILMSNEKTDSNTRTITHVLWSLLNILPQHSAQRPHRHNSVALDLCVTGGSERVYTLMGPELDEDGWVKNPLRIEWISGGVFITPPGWYHSHHNDSDEDAIVLPIQDAGLYTYQRTLNIEFA
jgi:gentisate 1,2-dioxygenase